MCACVCVCLAMPRQDGKVVIVTGGGSGIGYEVVRHMARLGAHVIIGTVSSTTPVTHAAGHSKHGHNKHKKQTVTMSQFRSGIKPSGMNVLFSRVCGSNH